MSYVTNVLLHHGVSEDEDARMAEVNAFFSAERHRRGLVGLEAPGDWYGGTKAFEQPLYVGAFNSLDREGFLRHLVTAVRWEYPGEVQVIWCGQDDDVFSVVTLKEADVAGLLIFVTMLPLRLVKLVLALLWGLCLLVLGVLLAVDSGDENEAGRRSWLGVWHPRRPMDVPGRWTGRR